MKGSLLSIFVFFAVLATAYSIKCYVCGPKTDDTCTKDNLKKDSKYEQDCTLMDQCIRLWGKVDDTTTITNMCGNDVVCKKFKDACDDAKEGECAVGCCKTDLCNAGSPISFSVFLMTVCLALGLALLK